LVRNQAKTGFKKTVFAHTKQNTKLKKILKKEIIHQWPVLTKKIFKKMAKPKIFWFFKNVGSVLFFNFVSVLFGFKPNQPHH